MCMNISKEDIIRINSGFGGNLITSSSLEFALAFQKDLKIGPYKKLAFLLRAILVDHPFTDGNKRTAAFLALSFAEENTKQINDDLLLHHITSISKQNIINIRNIEWRMKNAIQ